MMAALFIFIVIRFGIEFKQKECKKIQEPKYEEMISSRQNEKRSIFLNGWCYFALMAFAIYFQAL